MSLSVFNESVPPITPNAPVRNSGWNAIATIMAARKLADSIAKAAEKRMVSNGAMPVHNDRMKALHTGLGYFCDSVEHIAQYIRANPNENVVGSVKEAIQHLDNRVDEIVSALEGVDESGRAVEYHIDGITSALAESSNTLDWIKHRFYVADDLTGGMATDTPGTQDNYAVPCWGAHVTGFDSFQSLYNSQNGG